MARNIAEDISLAAAEQAILLADASTEASVVIEPRRGLDLDLREVWRYRELLYFLIWRDLKVRYRQTAIGAGWVIIQPLLTMVVFTAVFGHFAKIPSDGVPYAIFTFTALLPWNLFASSLARGGDSVVGNANLVCKVYFPRLILPLAGVLSPMADFAVAFLVLIAMMFWYGVFPSIGILALPIFIFLVILVASAVGLWTSALTVRYRDVRHTLPFLTQLWMFASPVAYPVSLVPEKWRYLYGLNPLAGVIEGCRWALLGKEHPDFWVMTVSTVMVLVMLIGGVYYFKRTERIFADLV